MTTRSIANGGRIAGQKHSGAPGVFRTRPLVEVFDQPGRITRGRERGSAVRRRVAACVTRRDGRFGSPVLPPGDYELRLSLGRGWNVVHPRLRVDPRADGAVSSPIKVLMYPGI